MGSARGPQAAFGDLLPLPLVEPDEVAVSQLCAGARQRVDRRGAVARRMNASITALNGLAGFDEPGSWPGVPLNLAQVSALQHLRALHLRRRPPGVQGDEASLRRMLKTSANYEPVVGELAPYVPGAVSLPRGQGSPLPLDSALEGDALEAVLDPEQRMLLSDVELAEVMQCTDLPGMHVDPVLAHNASMYARFIGELFRAGLVRFDLRGRCRVGVFLSPRRTVHCAWFWTQGEAIGCSKNHQLPCWAAWKHSLASPFPTAKLCMLRKRTFGIFLSIGY